MDYLWILVINPNRDATCGFSDSRHWRDRFSWRSLGDSNPVFAVRGAKRPIFRTMANDSNSTKPDEFGISCPCLFAVVLLHPCRTFAVRHGRGDMAWPAQSAIRSSTPGPPAPS